MQQVGLNADYVSRINYVSYPSKAACSQHVTHSVSPPLTFGNGGAQIEYKSTHLNYLQHSRYIFGDRYTFFNRMAQELVFGMWNYGQELQLGNINIANIITGMTYEDENRDIQSCDPLPFHPIHDSVHVNFMRARFQRHKNIAMAYYIGITKSEYKSKQAQLI